jgi:hypothetical protein
MVELVDTQDLKSCSRKRSAGSIPALSTKALIHVRIGAFCFYMYRFDSGAGYHLGLQFQKPLK